MDSQLQNLLLLTMSPRAEDIKSSERQLTELQSQEGFALTLLKLCGSADRLDVAKAASIYFKNYVKRNWSPITADTFGLIPNARISDVDRQLIKAHIVEFMCTVPPSVQRQLSEAVRVVAETDWPKEWQNLLPGLVGRLQDQNVHVLVGVLSTMNELFKRFRDAAQSNELWEILKYALEIVQEPILLAFKMVVARTLAGNMDPNNTEQMYAVVRLMCRIFYSLNWQTIPEFFEDHVAEWMVEFQKFLVLQQDPFPQYTDDENPGPLEKVQTAVFENVRLYAEKYSEEFAPHSESFIQNTFHLLVARSKSPQARFDEMLNNGMRFLSTLVASPLQVQFFGQEQILKAILEHVVVPNLLLQERDVEAFEDNPMEYLRRDIEGGDAETRRRIACDMIEKLSRNFDAQVTTLCAGYIGQLLTQYRANPSREWKAKDAAITLVLAVAVRGSTRNEGATKVNDVGTVMGFLKSDILPELNPSVSIDSTPIVKADAIKYIATFRKFINKADALQTVFPMLVNALNAKSIVVHSYAAAAIDGLLGIRESNTQQFRFTQQDMAPFFEPILIKLFGLLDSLGSENCNETLIKCVIRVVNIARKDVGPIVPGILQKLSIVLTRIAANPANPEFNHYLFESIAALLKFGFESGKVPVEQLEACINPTFEKILSSYITEFVPYVFQIMGQTLRMRPNNVVPPHFMMIFQSLFEPTLWESRSNVPALVSLLEAYLVRGADQVIAGDAKKLNQLFDVYYRLLGFKSTEDMSFELARSVVSFCRFDVVRPHLPQVFAASLSKLQQPNASISLARSFVVFMCVLIGRRGAGATFEICEATSRGLFVNLVRGVWIPAFAKVTNSVERKACIVGATKVLCEFPQFVQNDRDAWIALLRATMALLAEINTGAGDMLGAGDSERTLVTESLERMAEAGHGTSFQRLQFAHYDDDLFPEISNPTRYVAECFAANPGLLQIAPQALEQDKKLLNVFLSIQSGAR